MRRSKSEILAKTSGGLDVMEYYLGRKIIHGKAIKSPFREDKHPSFSFFQSKKNNIWFFKDHGRDDIKGDAIQFVMLMFKLTFIETLMKIYLDLNLNEPFQKLRPVIKPIPFVELRQFSYELKGWSVDELFFFSSSGIELNTLDRYKVKPVECITIKKEDKEYKVSSTVEEPAFIYQFTNGCKLYRPKSNNRFLYLGEKPNPYVFGLDQLPDTGKDILITGGEKDVLTFAAMGFPAVCFNSETAAIPEDILHSLKKRFRNVLLCYDMDKTGKESSTHLSQKHGLIRVELPLDGSKENKDITDYVKKGASLQDVQQQIDLAVISRFKESITILKQNIFNEKNLIEKPDPAISIDEQTILSRGNLGVISGKVKSGKSAVIYAIIAGAIIRSNYDVDTLGLKVLPNEDEKAILHFETEQSKYDWHARFMKILDRAGIQSTPDYLKSFYLVDQSLYDRIRFIKEMVEYHSRLHKGVHLIVVDGVADLIKSVNDEEASNKIVEFFHRMAADYNCPILLVVHLNPDGLKNRGHLGSQLDRKAESVLIVEKDDQISTIKPKYCRNADPYSIAQPSFIFDDTIKMHVFHGMKSLQQRAEQKIDELTDALDEIFKEKNLELTKTDFKEQLCKVLNIKKSAAYNTIGFMISQRMIEEISGQKKMIRRMKNAA